MQLDHRPYKLLVTGASGTGKTTYWTRYLLGTVAQLKFVFDHEGEFAFRNKIRAATTPEELGIGAHQGWCVFDPGRMFPGDLPSAFNFFCEWAFQVSSRTNGRKLFACDELQTQVGTNQISRELALVLETGRRYGLDAAMISQQPNLIHNRIRNQLTEAVSFRQLDQSAMEWLEGVGFDPEALRGLPDGAYLDRNLKSGAVASGRLF